MIPRSGDTLARPYTGAMPSLTCSAPASSEPTTSARSCARGGGVGGCGNVQVSRAAVHAHRAFQGFPSTMHAGGRDLAWGQHACQLVAANMPDKYSIICHYGPGNYLPLLSSPMRCTLLQSYRYMEVSPAGQGAPCSSFAQYQHLNGFKNTDAEPAPAPAAAGARRGTHDHPLGPSTI